MLICSYIAYSCFQVTDAELCSYSRPRALQSMKRLPSGPLQKKRFTETSDITVNNTVKAQCRTL